MNRILPVAVFAVGLTVMLVVSQQKDEPLVVSGLIEADDVRVGSRVGGRVATVHVAEGDQVAAGQPLLELQPYDLRERKAQAEQTLAAAAANLRRLTAGFRHEEVEQARALRDEAAAAVEELRNGPRPQEIAAAESQVRLAEAELKKASRDYERVETLFGQQAADQSDLDEAGTRLSVTQATLEERRENLDLLNAGTRPETIAQAEARLQQREQEYSLRKAGYRTEEIDEARASQEAARAALAVIERQFDELKVTAPFDGVVEAVDLRPGDIVSPNAPVVSLIDTHRLYVRAYVPENRLALSNGQTVQISVDSFPAERFEGEVTFIARQAEFTPGNVQTPEERSKQVFRIRVELSTGLDRLRPGMAADVHLDGSN